MNVNMALVEKTQKQNVINWDKNMILNEKQKELVNNMINNLEMLLSEEDIGTREKLSRKDILFILLNTNIDAVALYLQLK